LFTGRRLDILDNGSLTIQYSRNRCCDYYTGRFTTHDPLGITPNPPKPNIFEIVRQYKASLNLYEYVGSKPLNKVDPCGLGPVDNCWGPVVRWRIPVWSIKDKRIIMVTLGYYSVHRQSDSCCCQDCCDRADKMYLDDVGYYAYRYTAPKRQQRCYKDCHLFHHRAIYLR